MGGGPDVGVQVEAAQQRFQRPQPIRVRVLVDAIDEWQLRVPGQRRHGLVGGQHEVLDDALRLAPGHEQYVLGLAGLVQHEFGLVDLKVDGAPGGPLAPQHVGEGAHVRQRRADSLGDVGLAAFKIAVRRFVGQPRVGVDDRFHEPMVHDPALLDVHEQAQGQAIHVRHQRAEVVGQAFRQHRHGQPRQVQRGAPLQRVPVDGGARTDVVADIGDVYPQPPALFRALDGNGVVKVLCGGAVDGEGEQRAQVLPPDGVLGLYRIGHGLGFLQDRPGGLGGEALVLRDRAHQRRQALLVAQHPQDACVDRTAGLGIAVDGEQGDFVVIQRVEVSGQHHVVGNAHVAGDGGGHRLDLRAALAHGLEGLALDAHIGGEALPAPAEYGVQLAVFAQRAHQHQVVGHAALCATVFELQRSPAPDGLGHWRAVALEGDPRRAQPDGLGDGPAALPGSGDASFPGQFVQRHLYRLEGALVLLGKLPRGQRHARGFDLRIPLRLHGVHSFASSVCFLSMRICSTRLRAARWTVTCRFS